MIKNPALRILSAIVIVILVLIGYLLGNKNIDKIKAWDFKGVVEKVTIEESKDSPIITVNGRDYDLSNIRLNKNIGIYKGDTLIKKKGDMVLKLIKPNTKDTIYCNKP